LLKHFQCLLKFPFFITDNSMTHFSDKINAFTTSKISVNITIFNYFARIIEMHNWLLLFRWLHLWISALNITYLYVLILVWLQKSFNFLWTEVVFGDSTHYFSRFYVLKDLFTIIFLHANYKHTILLILAL
jgi:hypothetical protein